MAEAEWWVGLLVVGLALVACVVVLVVGLRLGHGDRLEERQRSAAGVDVVRAPEAGQPALAAYGSSLELQSVMAAWASVVAGLTPAAVWVRIVRADGPTDLALYHAGRGGGTADGTAFGPLWWWRWRFVSRLIGAPEPIYQVRMRLHPSDPAGVQLLCHELAHVWLSLTTGQLVRRGTATDLGPDGDRFQADLEERAWVEFARRAREAHGVAS